jgi:acetyl esterase
VKLADRLEAVAVRALARLPARLARRISGEPPLRSEGHTLDPHVQLVRALRRHRTPHRLCEPDLATARLRYRRETLVSQWPRTPVAEVNEFAIDGGDGRTLRVRHYRPFAEGAEPLTVYLHGGGFTVGDLDTHDEPCRILCREARTHVLSVAYRLAPEDPFPAALDDTRAALAWARANAAALGADPTRVAIGGDSAGANLAAVISLEHRDGPGAAAAQLLIYPPTDDRTPRPSQELYGDGWFLDRADRTAFTAFYLDGTGADAADWRVSPLLAADHSGQPPTLLVAAGFDLLRDEGMAYAEALEAAGAPVRRLMLGDQTHGLVHMTGASPGAAAAMRRIAAAWRELLDGRVEVVR